MSNNEATQTNSPTAATQAPVEARNNAQGKAANNQQKSKKGRNAAPELTKEQNDRLHQLIGERLRNPYAARELLTALESPGARFMNFANGATTQALKVLIDTDRGLTALDRLPALNVAMMEGRHSIEKKLALALEALVEVTVDIAVLANTHSPKNARPLLIIDPNVKARMPKMTSSEPAEPPLKAA